MNDTIILVPTKGDPYQLTANGPCFARPSVLYKHDDGAWTAGAGIPAPRERALLLMMDGQPVPDSVFRAWHQADGADTEGFQEALEGRNVAEWAAALHREGEPLGRVIILNTYWREVAARV